LPAEIPPVFFGILGRTNAVRENRAARPIENFSKGKREEGKVES
jgi:hypothetical protein